ncbi:MAG: hypothetical protein COB67_10160 [SAR324 cluster bacterium]|uniref:Outer membrane protein beta-barrel domain-containing protein n=1 Tax=SAR324 cluster bacterium TaxID=2024889 RepID=A0A2A4SY49_9DELT|nr:MAG: hypothetical protein COB67_10160 [SAR324 cluster bacterium]
MLRKKLLALGLLIACWMPASLMADQWYGGVGISINPGESNADVNRVPLIIAYETEDLWRFAFTDTEFKSKGSKLVSRIFGAERMWVSQLESGFTLISSFGPGYFMSKSETGSANASGGAIGIIAGAALRLAMDETWFLQGSMEYKNAAVDLDGTTVNAGYQGLTIAAGYFF